MKNKVVLGFSGGLDTTFCVKWLQENNFEPICVTLDIGQEKDIRHVEKKANDLDVKTIKIVNGIDDFADYFIVPALKANALYEGVYPLATALSRPYVGKIIADTAKEIGTKYVAHGCTGKGNDQVRIELAINALMPGAIIIDPIRDNNLSRDDEIKYLKEKNIKIEVTKEKPYSIDQNIWGRSICAGILEDMEKEPPEEVFEWTRSIDKCPDKPGEIEIGFESGIPKSLNKKTMSVKDIIIKLNEIGGLHGIGRIDHIEDRVVGIKSREIYEAPAAIILIKAHKILESITLTKSSLKFKNLVEKEYADIIYEGKWFSNHHMDLISYLQHNQKNVTGNIRMKLHKGNCIVISRESKYSLYDKSLATYTSKSTFDQSAAKEFIKIYGMENNIQAQKQLFNFREETKLIDS